MIDFFFIRHGQTDYNAAKIVQGQCDRSNLAGVRDLGLNEKGRHQAATAAASLKALGLQPEIVLSSDLKRAFETGEVLAETFGINILPEKGLREMFFGADWEGRPVSLFKEQRFTPPMIFHNPTSGETFEIADGEALRAAHKSTEARFGDIRHPGGESKNEVAARAVAALRAFALGEGKAYRRILIPTHNGLLRFVMPSLGPVDHTECIHVAFDPEKAAAFVPASLDSRLLPTLKLRRTGRGTAGVWGDALNPLIRHPREGGDPGDWERMNVFQTGLTILARYKNAEA